MSDPAALRLRGADPRPQGEPAAEYVHPATLTPWAENPRVNDHAVDEVAASIQRYGFGAPILARRANREIIAGHTRWKASQRLGLDLVPCRFLDVDERTAHKLALVDNKTHELAAWDQVKLGEVLRAMRVSEPDLKLPAFPAGMVTRLVNLPPPAALVAAAAGAQPEKPAAVAVSKPGEMYELGLYLRCPCCGDPIDV